MAIYVQVVDSGSFSKAARQLGLTTSAVSRHVARLEADMGGRLLQRTTRSLAMTELGQLVYQGCSRMVSAAREVQTLAGSYSARPTGQIRVSAPIVFGQCWLAPRMPGFLARFPEVDVHMTLIDRHVDLIEEGVDVAIRIADTLPPGLVARPFFQARYVLVATPAWLAAHPAPRHPRELANTACLHLGYARFQTPWSFRRGDEVVPVSVRGRMTMNNSAAILAAVLAGGGIGVLADYTAQEALHSGQLQPVLPDWAIDAPSAGTASMVYVPGRHMALKVRALIDYLLEG